jgi:1-acyl-sn-glycerol-3-phosphate acyltransferase
MRSDPAPAGPAGAPGAEWLPEVPDPVPRRGYGLLSWLGRTWLRVAGWRVIGTLPDCPRLVVAVAPHSSNLDFVHVAAAVFALRLRVSFLGKHTLFHGPLGRFMHWMGGIPVDRSAPGDIADQLVHTFAQRDRLWLGIAPEGTRTAGTPYRTGFYRIAQAAGVPILPVYFDYARRCIGLLPPVDTGPDVDAGVEALRAQIARVGVRRDRQPPVAPRAR